LLSFTSIYGLLGYASGSPSGGRSHGSDHVDGGILYKKNVKVATRSERPIKVIAETITKDVVGGLLKPSE